MSSDGYSDAATDINLSIQVIPYTYESTTRSQLQKTKVVATASCVKPVLIYWPKPSDSRRSKQMPGIKSLKNNLNIYVFTIVLFLTVPCVFIYKTVFKFHA